MANGDVPEKPHPDNGELTPPLTLTREDAILATALFLAMLVTGSFAMVPYVSGALLDDSVYVVTAMALAEGQGYRQLHLPGEPYQTKYPVLYPAALALLYQIAPSFPDYLPLMKGFTLGCGALGLALAYLYLVRFGYATRPQAIAATLLCVSSFRFNAMAATTMSEMPFLLGLVGALWSLDKEIRSSAASRWPALLCGAMLAMPAACRAVGVVVLFTGLAGLWRYGRSLRWPVLGAALLLLIGTSWHSAYFGQWRTGGAGSGGDVDYFGWIREVGWHAFGKVIAQNGGETIWLLTIQGADGITAVKSSLPSAAWALIPVLFGVAALALLVFRLHRFRPLEWILLAYLLVVLVWPWPPSRFLLPVLPLWLIYPVELVSRGIRAVTRQPFVSGAVGAAALSLILLLNGRLFFDSVEQVRQSGWPNSPNDPSELAAKWSSFTEVFTWLKANTQPDDLVASFHPSMTYLYTGRQSFSPLRIRPAALYGAEVTAEQVDQEMVQSLEKYRPRFILVNAFLPELQHSVERLRADHPDMFRSVYQAGDTRFAIYEVHFPDSR
ncbi:hypothetical protein AYO44_08410 [Planctomycetaceae bacterium SCGC AG-212-F19]|nr:hypothetical protein AYO44_08410 [Planctomycetaceae bacterium SCGC AG-212-F19]